MANSAVPQPGASSGESVGAPTGSMRPSWRWFWQAVQEVGQTSTLRLLYSAVILVLALLHLWQLSTSLSKPIAAAWLHGVPAIPWWRLFHFRFVDPGVVDLFFLAGYVGLLLWNNKVFIHLATKYAKHAYSKQYFIDFDKDNKKAPDSEIKEQFIRFRLAYRILVGYYIEVINLVFGLLVVLEGVRWELVDATGPWPKVVLELGIAFLVAAIISVMFEVQHRESTFGEPVRAINSSVAAVQTAVNRLEQLVGKAPTDLSATADAEHKALKADNPAAPEGGNGARHRSLSVALDHLQSLIGDIDDDTEENNGEPATLSSMVLHLKHEVAEANRISGYVNYRNQIQEAYSTAEHRIVSIADAWVTDRQWWVEGQWEDCPLYSKLVTAFSALEANNRCEQLRVVFAGDVSWPQTRSVAIAAAEGNDRRNGCNGSELEHDPSSSELPVQNDISSGQFEPQEFERFLGVVWRLVIAHKLRARFKLSRMDTIRVVVASVPIEATVVDHDVFILLPDPATPKNIEFARGTKIAQNYRPLADAYEQMLRGYLRHSRSAREYVEAVLYFGALHMTADLDTSLADRPKDIENCLDTLGLVGWEKWRRSQNYMPKDCRRHAITIVEAFWDMNRENAESFSDMRRNLL